MFVTRNISGLLAMAMMMLTVIPAFAVTDKTCLTGNDPAVAADQAQIAALEAVVDAACPCASYDGSDGQTQRDYLRCAKTQVKAAVEDGRLRTKCRSRVTKGFKLSTCGYAAAVEAVPCLERSTRGTLRCRIVPAAECVDREGRYTRIDCPDYARCVDAGDSNDDYLTDTNDSGACAALPTATATPTSTFTPTPTITPTSTVTATAACGSSPPQAVVVVHHGSGAPEERPRFLDNACYPSPDQSACTFGASQGEGSPCWDDDQCGPFGTCEPLSICCNGQNPSGGGCLLRDVVDGNLDTNVFTANESFVPECGPETELSYKWEILFPPALALGGTVYASNGISGYLTDTLTIQPSSLPALEDTGVADDVFWRVRLTITTVDPPITQSVVYFRFQYRSELGMQMWSDCQRIGYVDGVECTEVGRNGLPTTEPH